MYGILESSRDGAIPVELYQLDLGAQTWRYTSADENLDHGGHVFVSAPISRTEVELTPEVNRSGIKIMADAIHPIPVLFRAGAPVGLILVRVYAKHRGDADAAVIFMGRVTNCDFSGREAALSTEPISTSIRQNGLRRLYSKPCPHQLYGPACRLARADWESAATVSAVSGGTLTVTGANTGTSGYFTGGLLRWIDGSGNPVWAMVAAHPAGSVRLLRPVPGLGAGAAVTLWPGCDHQLKTCRQKFSNNENYGGFPWIPGANPFQVSIA